MTATADRQSHGFSGECKALRHPGGCCQAVSIPPTHVLNRLEEKTRTPALHCTKGCFAEAIPMTSTESFGRRAGWLDSIVARSLPLDLPLILARPDCRAIRKLSQSKWDFVSRHLGRLILHSRHRRVACAAGQGRIKNRIGPRKTRRVFPPDPPNRIQFRAAGFCGQRRVGTMGAVRPGIRCFAYRSRT